MNYKYFYKGEPVKRLLPKKKDYNYFLNLVRTGIPIDAAYEKTAESKTNDGRRQYDRMATVKYMIKGKPIRQLLANKADISYFYVMVFKLKNAEAAYKLTIKNKRRRDARIKEARRQSCRK